MENEIWKDIIGFEGLYQISNKGNIYSFSIKSNKKIQLSKRGYFAIGLNKKGKFYLKTIHQLIAIHFIDNPFNKKYVNHIDGNPLNNEISNLEWVNNMENSCHCQKIRNHSSAFIGVGWDKYAKKWKSQIYFNKKSIHLGNFNTEIEAYNKRCEFEKQNNIVNKYL